MRNTLFTSLALCLSLAPAWAEPIFGCFAKTYSPEFLNSHPDQSVSSIWLKLHQADGSEGMNAPIGSVIADLTVTLADQPHVTRNHVPTEEFPNGFAGQTMYQVFRCNKDGTQCAEACMASLQDDNAFEILSNDGATLTLRLTSLVVGQGQDCGGFTDIASTPGELTEFTLNREADQTCNHDPN